VFDLWYTIRRCFSFCQMNSVRSTVPFLSFRRLGTLGSLLVAVSFVGCGSSGSGSSGGGPPPPPQNPVPEIVSLSPNSANAGGAAFTLTITGNNFMSSSSVQWNGSTVTATYSASNQLQAQISAAEIASSGSATVSVTNPSPGGGNSGLAEFTINPTSNPLPSLASLSPAQVNAGASASLLTVDGENFTTSSTVEWNGATLSTTYLSDTQLEAQIPASDLTTPGFADVVVFNPSPGGGISAPVVFTIAYAPIVVSQLTNDLVWDATHQLIYLSVPSLASSNGNTVAALNPTNGDIQSSQFAGSEPDVLAISDDDQYLYAGLDGASSVQRFVLPGLSPDIDYSLGAAGNLGPTFAVDLQVAPGLPDTTAVSRGVFIVSPYAQGGMTIYDDATPRPTSADSHGQLFDSLQWGSDTAIYSINSEISTFNLYVLTVSPSGVVVSSDYQNEFSGFYIKIHYDSGTGLVYTDDGYAINPSNGKHVGAFQASGLMVPDSTLNSAFFLGQTELQGGTQAFTIESFDLTTFVPIAEMVIPNVQGNPLRFIRWGTSGLAFNDDAGYVYIIDSSFVAPSAVQVKTPQHYIMPVRKTWSAPKTLRSRELAEKSRSNFNSSSSIRRTGRKLSHPLDSNPVPSLTGLNPSAVEVGINSFILTVTGTDFVSLSSVEWNGSSLPTEYVSSTQLQAQVSASAVASVGSASVSVITPSPGGGTSSALPFTIVATSNPVPSILGLTPNFAAAGSSGFTLDVNGSFFNGSSVVLWNGSPRPTNLYGPGQLQAQVSAADIASAGYAQITVSNPGPGGGISNTAEFQILYQAVIVSQATNDIVWDPLNQVIYLSVPSSASTNANQVCILNPTTAAIVKCQAAGSEPDVLAISDDSQFLYVGEDGTGSVQRFILPDLVPDISYSLGSEGEIPYYALDLQVAPGAPHTTAVSKGTESDPASTGGITIYDDATPRPVSAPGWGPTDDSYDSLQWGSEATELYSANSETTAFDFYALTVSSSGVVLSQDYPAVFWNPGRIHYDSANGLIYSDDGFHCIDPSTGLPVGIFEGGDQMAPDSNLNTVFVLDQYVWQESGDYTIDIFDMTHFTPVNRVPFSTVPYSLTQLNRFIRWGTNGLAVNDTSLENVYLISGSFVSGNLKRNSRSEATNTHRTSPISGTPNEALRNYSHVYAR
jgi:trimeric autotransporter adhesin